MIIRLVVLHMIIREGATEGLGSKATLTLSPEQPIDPAQPSWCLRICWNLNRRSRKILSIALLSIIWCAPSGARDPKVPTLFQISDIDTGVIRWVNADHVQQVVLPFELPENFLSEDRH